MVFSKCIALNSLVKETGTREGSRYDAVSVKFSMYSLGNWSAEIEFQGIILSSEVDTIVDWAISNTCSHCIFGCQNGLVLAVQ